MFSKLATAALLASSVSAEKVAEIFSKAGAQPGMCANLKNSHPMSTQMDQEMLEGKWLTVFIDSGMAENQSECLTAEFIKSFDGSDSMIYKINELTRLVPITPQEGEAETTGMRMLVSGQTTTLVNINEDVPEEEKARVPPRVYNQFSYGPTNKFTQVLDISEVFAEDTAILKDKVIATVTCVQAEMPAPLRFIKEEIKRVKEQTGEEIEATKLFAPDTLYGRMVQLYEVHMKKEALDLFQGKDQALKDLKSQISDFLGLDQAELLLEKPVGNNQYEVQEIKVDRLIPVEQSPEICQVMDQI